MLAVGGAMANAYSAAWERNVVVLGNSRKRHMGVLGLLFVLVIFWSSKLSFSIPGNSVPLNSNSISTSKAAVIVENRPLDNLIPLILHFSSVLGPEWPIHIFTSEENVHFFAESAPFQRNIKAGRFIIRTLPPSVNLDRHSSVSGFFTKPWFWEQMAPAEKILTFQGDSIICSNAKQTIDNFLQYDFIGAPIDTERGLGHGYNGGLSLRNREMILDIVRRSDWEEDKKKKHDKANVDYEDQWFWTKMMELPPKADGSPQANLPSMEIAMTFSVETMWYEKPLGYHQAHVWQSGKMDQVMHWCPEYKLATTKTFTDHS